MLPEPQPYPPPATAFTVHPEDQTHHVRLVPITLDTVLHLAEEQNGQVAIAREKVREACAAQEVARYHWVPDVWAGIAFYRHEGGIQQEDGTLIHSSTGALFPGIEIDAKLDVREVAYFRVSAERRTWQQKGDLSKVTSDTLLDAGQTYIDLLAARTGISISLELQHLTVELLERTRKLAGVDQGLQVEVHRIEAELDGLKYKASELEGEALQASAKLTYLLGLDPCVVLMPVDAWLVPIPLIDISVPTCELVARALANGPGIHAMEGLLSLVQQSIERAQGPGRFLPVFEARTAEGGFGAGPGDDFRWDNRWDLGLQARWNLNELVALRQRREVTHAQLQQLHLSYDDLRRKLSAGVQGTQAALGHGYDEMHHSEEQVRHARQAYDLSRKRLWESVGNATPSEVILSIQNLGRAQMNYINGISDFDKNQIRLMVLLGPACCAPFVAPCRPADAAPMPAVTEHAK